MFVAGGSINGYCLRCYYYCSHHDLLHDPVINDAVAVVTASDLEFDFAAAILSEIAGLMPEGLRSTQ